MKNLLLVLALLIVCDFSFAQTKPQPKPQPAAKPAPKAVVEEEANCYMEWYKAFQKYGTSEITDGTHDIIITLCKDGRCDCMLGKVDVAGGQIVRYSLYILQEDETYEKPNRSLSPKYTNPEAGLEMHIHDGMSPAFLTSQDETVYLMFYKALNKVPKKPRKAPKPKDLEIY